MAVTVQARVSTVNYAATANWSVTSEQPGWPGINGRFPHQPLTPWRTTSLADNDLFLDFGSVKPVGLVMAVRITCRTPQVFLGTPAAGWTFAQNVPLQYNVWNRTYCTALAIDPPHLASRMIFRNTLNVLGDTTSIDTQPYFSLGGVWVGPLVPIPRDIRWGEQVTTLEPRAETVMLQGGSVRSPYGPPLTRITAKRISFRGSMVGVPSGAGFGTSPFGGYPFGFGSGTVVDELPIWLEFDRLTFEAGAFAWYSNRGYAGDCWIVRRLNEPSWPIHQVVSEDTLVMEEVVGP